MYFLHASGVIDVPQNGYKKLRLCNIIKTFPISYESSFSRNKFKQSTILNATKVDNFVHH